MALHKTYYVYPTPLGRITLESDGQALTRLGFGAKNFEGELKATALTNEAANQVQQYLAGKRREFVLPLNLQGTDFQKRVWSALQTIPYGQTRSYQQVAAMINNERAYRAVGNANNKNPIPIIVPCHRVIGVHGDLVGYADGIKIKQFLLDLEKRVLCSEK